MSHTAKTPPTANAIADLPDAKDGTVAYDAAAGKPVARINGAWESIAGGGGGTPTVVYDDGAAIGNTDQIQGDIPADWKQNDSSLRGLVIGTSCTSIGSLAFDYCFGLTGSLVIPDSVTTIGLASFFFCTGLNGSLTIGNSVTSIGDNAFNGCSSITALYTNTPAASWVGTNALNGTTALVNIYEGPDVTGQYSATFQGGSGMTVSAWTNYPNIP